MAILESNTDLDVKGRVLATTVPNSTGSIVTWNASTKVFGLRTNAQILADLGLTSVVSNSHNPLSLSSATGLTLNIATQVLGVASGYQIPTNAQVNTWNSALQAVNLSLGTRTGTTMPINNSGGTNVTLPSATTTQAGLMSAGDKANLTDILTVWGRGLRIDGNSTWVGGSTLSGNLDVVRNASMYASSSATGKPTGITTDMTIVNFTSGSSTVGGIQRYSGFDLAASVANDRLFARMENMAAKGGWLELAHSGNINSMVAGNYVPYTGATSNVNLGTRSITSTGGFIGNATTATTLATARTINGTSFNGSANITTANWGTARNITIGNTTKSVNGSANVSWSLAEIGASGINHTHPISDIVGLQTELNKIGNLPSLITTNKNNLVDAINEVNGSLGNYLPLAGGTMNSGAVINWAGVQAFLQLNSVNKLRYSNVATILSASSTAVNYSQGIFIRPQGDTVNAGQIHIDYSGQINTANHGNSSQWKQAYDWVSLGGVSRTIVSLNSSNDLDLVVQSGYYHHAGGSAPLNTPMSGAGYLEVINNAGTNLYVRQIWRERGGSHEYQRTRNFSGIWSLWVEYITTDNLDSEATSLGFIKSSALPTVNNGQLTLSTGTGLSGSATFTANQSGSSTFTVGIASTHKLPTTVEVSNWDDAYLLRHSHSNKGVLDNLTQSVIDNSHTHANKALLDTYDQTNADITDAVDLRHSHTNKSILDSITAAFTTAEKDKLADIEPNAQVNVNADWNAISGDAEILNKPSIPTSSDYITTNTNQTGLSGNKTTSGIWTFSGINATPLRLERTNSINTNIEYINSGVSIFAGSTNGTAWAVGGLPDLTLVANRWFWVDNTGTVFSKNGYLKTGATNADMLLGAGGHRPVSDFALLSQVYTQSQSLALFVGLSGVQTIADTKTFSSSPIVPNATLNGHAVNLGQLNTILGDYATETWVTQQINNISIPTVNDGQLSIATGTGLSGSVNFTANQAGNSSVTIDVANTHKLPTITEWNALPTTNTITRLRGTTSGTFTSGDLTLLEGTGIGVTQSGANFTITNTSPNINQTLSQSGQVVTLSNGGGSFTLPTNTTYSAGTGLSLTGTVFANTAPNATHTGDVTGATVLTIANNAVTLPKIQNIATQTFLGRATTGTGNVEALTVAQMQSLLGFSTQTLSNSTSNLIVSNTVQRAALTGDVTASQNSNATTIANNAVTHAKYQNIATQRILGRGATGSGNVQELTLGANLSLSTAGVLSATNTNTTYTAGTGLTLSGTTFGQTITTSGSGTFVKGITQTANGFVVDLSTPPNTTYSAGAGLTLSGTTFSLPITYSGTGNYVSAITQTTNGLTVTRGTLPALQTVNDGKFTVQGTGSITGAGSTTANASADTTATLDLTTNTKNQIQQGVWAYAALPQLVDGVDYHHLNTGGHVPIEKKKTIVNIPSGSLGYTINVDDAPYDGYELAINGCGEWSLTVNGSIMDKCGGMESITLGWNQGGSALFWWSVDLGMWMQAI